MCCSIAALLLAVTGLQFFLCEPQWCPAPTKHVFLSFLPQILQITAMKSLKRRGHVCVCFADLESAEQALEAMQGVMLFSKPMRIDFAKVDSDALTKRKGTFKPREKAPLPPKPSAKRQRERVPESGWEGCCPKDPRVVG